MTNSSKYVARADDCRLCRGKLWFLLTRSLRIVAAAKTAYWYQQIACNLGCKLIPWSRSSSSVAPSIGCPSPSLSRPSRGGLWLSIEPQDCQGRRNHELIATYSIKRMGWTILLTTILSSSLVSDLSLKWPNLNATSAVSVFENSVF